ncbi:MAG TPA: MFS transporter [Thermoanaerobaculia bacterium]|nr:MFS transporter [Thermoanaerobaculia bacterium]
MAAPEPLLTPRFAALWLYAFVTFFSAFQLLPAIPFRIIDLGGSTAAAGWFLSAYTFASAFSAPLMGTIADRVGRRRLLLVASLAFCGFSIAYGLITNIAVLLFVGMIHGALWSGLLSSAAAIMTDYIPESRRTQGLSYWGLASVGAVAVAPAVGLWVFHYGWWTLCVEMAALSVLMTAGALLIHDPTQPHARHRGALADAWDWGVIRTTFTMSVASFGYGGITSYAALLAVQRHIEPKSIYLTVYAVTIVLFRLFFSHLLDRVGTKTLLYPALALVPIAFATLGLATTRAEMVASAIVFGIGWGAAYPALATFIINNTDPARRARTFGSIVWAFDTGIGLGSLAVGSLGEHFGLGRAFLAAAALSCFSIPIFAWTSRLLAANGTSLAGSSGDAGTTR